MIQYFLKPYELFGGVYNIDINGFALKTKYDTDKPELENKILDPSRIAKKPTIMIKSVK